MDAYRIEEQGPMNCGDQSACCWFGKGPSIEAKVSTRTLLLFSMTWLAILC